MHPRLVAQFDRQRQMRKACGGAPDRYILSLVGQIAGIEIGNVGVLYAGERRQIAEPVPDEIVDRPRDQPGIGQTEFDDAGEDLHDDGLVAEECDKNRMLRLRIAAGIAQGIGHGASLARFCAFTIADDSRLD